MKQRGISILITLVNMKASSTCQGELATCQLRWIARLSAIGIQLQFKFVEIWSTKRWSSNCLVTGGCRFHYLVDASSEWPCSHHLLQHRRQLLCRLHSSFYRVSSIHNSRWLIEKV
ncbi:hypothetical protein ACET3Z_021673 [Daucus carota]